MHGEGDERKGKNREWHKPRERGEKIVYDMQLIDNESKKQCKNDKSFLL